MGKIRELTVRIGLFRKGMRREYTLTADISDEQELSIAKHTMETLIMSWLSAAEVQTAKQTAKLHEYKEKFPSELVGFLSFEDGGAFVKVTPRQYLGNEIFGRLMDVVKRLGGEYVSNGKDSHFRIPK